MLTSFLLLAFTLMLLSMRMEIPAFQELHLSSLSLRVERYQFHKLHMVGLAWIRPSHTNYENRIRVQESRETSIQVQSSYLAVVVLNDSTAAQGLTASNDSHNLHSSIIEFQCRGNASEDSVVKRLHQGVIASDVKILTHNNYVDGVGKVVVEDTCNLAVGGHFLDLIGCWKG